MTKEEHEERIDEMKSDLEGVEYTLANDCDDHRDLSFVVMQLAALVRSLITYLEESK